MVIAFTGIPIGVSCSDPEKLKKFILMDELDHIELKLAPLAKNGFSLIEFDGKSYRLVLESARYLKDNLGNKNISFHIPTGNNLLVGETERLYDANQNHHKQKIALFMAIAELSQYLKRNIICVCHPPIIQNTKVNLGTLEEGCKTAFELYFELVQLIKEEKWSIQIAIENVSDHSPPFLSAGNKPEHFPMFIPNKGRIGCVIDTGHDLLSDESAKGITDNYKMLLMHLQTNFGKKGGGPVKDDKHMLATEDNLEGFWDWLELCKKHNATIVIEVNKHYSCSEIQEYARDLRAKLEI